MKRYVILLLALLLLCAACAGCGKKAGEETLPVFSVPETAEAAVIPQDEPEPVFDYEPGSMGIYVKADPNIEAAPEVLDSITMTLSDKDKELTRVRVSDRQFDLIKNGRQIGGFVLIDIPREMLEKAPDSWADFEAAADHIARQVMSDIYPSGAHINGGAHWDNGQDIPFYLYLPIVNDDGRQYKHFIYIGETYIYDFWHDQAWMEDGGETIKSTLVAKDIKPELNEHEPWTIHDFPDNPWASQG